MARELVPKAQAPVIDFTELKGTSFWITPRRDARTTLPIPDVFLLEWRDAEGRPQIMSMPKDSALNLLSTLQNWKTTYGY